MFERRLIKLSLLLPLVQVALAVVLLTLAKTELPPRQGTHPPVFYVPTARKISYIINYPARLAEFLVTLQWPVRQVIFGRTTVLVSDVAYLVGVALLWWWIALQVDRGVQHAGGNFASKMGAVLCIALGICFILVSIGGFMARQVALPMAALVWGIAFVVYALLQFAWPRYSRQSTEQT